MSNLVGRWESVDRSKGGIGEVIDLAKDASFVRGVVVLVNVTYTYDGARVTLQDPKTGESPPVQRSVTIAGDEMYLGDSEDRDSVRRRVGSPASGVAPIVGVWKYRHYAGSTAFERCMAKGHMEFRLPMPGYERGLWTAKDGVLTFETSGVSTSVDLRIEGELLVLMARSPDDSKGRAAFRRVDPWYEVPMSETEIIDVPKSAPK